MNTTPINVQKGYECPTLKKKMQRMWKEKMKVKRSLSKKPIKLVHLPQQKKHTTCETQPKHITCKMKNEEHKMKHNRS
jgi:hypothetical protein